MIFFIDKISSHLISNNIEHQRRKKNILGSLTDYLENIIFVEIIH